MDSVKLHRQDGGNRVNLGQKSAGETIAKLHALHLEIIRDEGQVIARIDEIEHFVDVRLNQVRGLRIDIREKQKVMRQMMNALPQLLEG